MPDETTINIGVNVQGNVDSSLEQILRLNNDTLQLNVTVDAKQAEKNIKNLQKIAAGLKGDLSGLDLKALNNAMSQLAALTKRRDYLKGALTGFSAKDLQGSAGAQKQFEALTGQLQAYQAALDQLSSKMSKDFKGTGLLDLDEVKDTYASQIGKLPQEFTQQIQKAVKGIESELAKAERDAGKALQTQAAQALKNWERQAVNAGALSEKLSQSKAPEAAGLNTQLTAQLENARTAMQMLRDQATPTQEAIDLLNQELTQLGIATKVSSDGLKAAEKELKSVQSALAKAASKEQKNYEKSVGAAGLTQTALTGMKVPGSDMFQGNIEAGLQEAQAAMQALQQQSVPTQAAIDRVREALQNLNNATLEGRQAIVYFQSYQKAADKAAAAISKLEGMQDARGAGIAGGYRKDFDAITQPFDIAGTSEQNVINQLIARTQELGRVAGEARSQFQTLSAQIRDERTLAAMTKRTDEALKNVARMRREWTQMSSRDFGQLDALEQGLNQAKLAGDVAQMRELNNQLHAFRANMVEAGKNTKSFGDLAKQAFSKFTGWYSISQMVMMLENRVREMASLSIEVDTSMTGLKKVTDETAASYSAYMDLAESRSKELAAELTDYIDATTNFARMGYDINEAAELGEVATIYKNVGDEVESVDEATNSLISTMTAFRMEADEALSIVDMANYVGERLPNNIAIY